MTLRRLSAYAATGSGRSVVVLLCTLALKVRFAFYQARVGRRFSARGRVRMHVDPSGQLSIGDDCRMNSGFLCNPVGGSLRMGVWIGPGASLSIGHRVGISNSTIVCMDNITIEDDVFIGGDCKIYDTDFHSLSAAQRIRPPDRGARTAPVVVKARAFIGGHSLILKGTTIGEEAVIGAASVVTGDVPSREVWAGNPARFLRRL